MTLEQRLRQLEDIEAITTLTYRYARAVNKGPRGNGVDLAAIPQLFTAGARWSSDELGTTVGAAAIAAELPSATASGSRPPERRVASYDTRFGGRSCVITGHSARLQVVN